MRVPVNEPILAGNEKKYLNECIDTGWISSEGPFVAKFEAGIAKEVNRQYGVAVCNGSVALDVAVEALGISHGDEVILPSFTIISCALPIVRSGAIPVVVDADPNTWNLMVDQIEAKITPKTKAIMVVHLYGLPAQMDPILALAKKYNLKVIEDAAEMLGQTYRGRPCGSFGDISTFSFYPNKHVTTGEGGMVMMNDVNLCEKAKRLRNLGFSPDSELRFIHEEMGWNFRMTNLQAALGVAQLEQLPTFLKKKRWIGQRYQELLNGLKNAHLPIEKTEYADNIYWVFGLVLKPGFSKTAREVMRELAKKGIATRPFFYPLHQQPVLRRMGYFKDAHCPNAEMLYERGFYVPSGLALTEEQIQYVAQGLREVIG